ncbi:MAG: hypothetical protein JJU37_04205 [Balneolaceae bacterium]|nr:hypothetical protein [Balneolaceae bacterium]
MRIKAVILFSCFWLLMSAGVFAQQSRFDEANTLLEQSQYRDAIELYKSIAEDGYHSGALWLNMGVAYSQLDSLGVAKFYLLKAEKYKETKALAGEGLEFVNDRFSRRSAVLPPLPWDRFFQNLADRYSLWMINLTAILILYFGVALIIGSWFRKDFRRLLAKSGYAVIGLSAILFLFAVIINYQQNRYGTGVMIDRQISVFQQPNEQSSVVSIAYEGYTMRVDYTESEGVEDWKYVRLENGMYGWIRENSLMIF